MAGGDAELSSEDFVHAHGIAKANVAGNRCDGLLGLDEFALGTLNAHAAVTDFL
jgi:hypothetical protein